MVLADVRSQGHPVLDLLVAERTVEGETVEVITLNMLPKLKRYQSRFFVNYQSQPHLT